MAGHDQDRAAVDPVDHALPGRTHELRIAGPEPLVEQHDVVLHHRGDGEAQAHALSAGQRQQAPVGDLGEPGEGQHRTHHRADGRRRHVQGGRTQVDVLGDRGLAVEAQPHAQQCMPRARDVDPAFGGLEGAGEHAQQGALAGAVAADQRDALTVPDLQVDVAEQGGEAAPGHRGSGAEEGRKPGAARRGFVARRGWLREIGHDQRQALEPDRGRRPAWLRSRWGHSGHTFGRGWRPGPSPALSSGRHTASIACRVCGRTAARGPPPADGRRG